MTDPSRPAVRYVIRWKQASELLAMTASILALAGMALGRL